MARWLAAVFLAGCTFGVRGLAPLDDAAVPDLSVDVQPPDLASAPDLSALPPLLQVSHMATGTTVFDLTAEGTFDWTHYGLSSATSVERKAAGPGVINASANTTLHQWPSYAPGFSWSDGVPTASATGTHTGAYVNGPTHGFTITMPASPTQHTAYVYFNTYNAVTSFGAQLGDGSAAPFSEMLTANGNDDVRYAITWRAATTTTLQVTWTLITDNGSGSVDLLAVTLQ